MSRRRTNVGIKFCPKCGKVSMKISFKKQPDGTFIEIWRCFEPMVIRGLPFGSICAFELPLHGKIDERSRIIRW